MKTTTRTKVTNWKRSIVSYPAIVAQPETVDDIVEIVKDPETYPSPVRAVASNHSTTRCGVADSGTLVDVTKMNKIIEIAPDPKDAPEGTEFRMTAQAGALYIDVAEELEKHGLQFYVNVELGNLSVGSAACGGTKDASFPGEFGQVASYAVSLKLVLPSGELVEVTGDDGELLQVMHSSYGLLGIVYEVTFKVKKLEPMSVKHVTYPIREFID
ncbi:MAG: FAD-binding oxidoreductase, partial [Thermoanaerobaculia bacterium]